MFTAESQKTQKLELVENITVSGKKPVYPASRWPAGLDFYLIYLCVIAVKNRLCFLCGE
jgi:hypothetical protein